MKKAIFAMLAMAAAVFAQSALAETVEIATAADWAAFANRVNNGARWLNAQLTADVTLTQESPRVGDADTHPYAGTFDGAGHRLTLNWNSTGVDHLAPFAYVSGATITNLHTSGAITSDAQFASGLIGEVHDLGATVSQCRSSVKITNGVNGDATSAGFIARTYWTGQTVSISDCLFDGSLLCANGNNIGGFVGFNFSATSLNIVRSLFAPNKVTVSETDGSSTFARGYSIAVRISYYKATLGTVEGTDASSMSAETLVAALGENWMVKNGKAMPKVFDGSTVLVDGEICTFASDETIVGAAGKSAITVEPGASAIINIKSGAVLTVTGGNASGTTGAAPAIYVPESSTLYIVGDGTLIATGGAAANGGAGGAGSSGEIDIDNVKGRGGAGGAGGAGGGGGAPAIGGIGGAGGAGGSGGDYTEWKTCEYLQFFADGNAGGDGSSGANGGGMGRVVILGNLTVQATAGAAGTSDGTGGRNGEAGTDEGSGWYYDFTGGGGGGGGGGARGQNAKYGIGGGGAGGAGGGGGGGGGTYQSRDYITAWGAGGAGGSSYRGTAGASGSSGGDQVAQGATTAAAGAVVSGGNGGDGGSANATRGDDGTFKSLDCVTLTVSPARTAAQPTALSSGDAPAAPIAVTFMSDGVSVGTVQASLMLAPPVVPAFASKTGYEFQGFYTADGTQIYSDSGAVYPVWQTVEDTTLYARWKLEAVDFTFSSGGAEIGTGSCRLSTSTATDAPIALKQGDDIFLGYFTEPTGGVQVYDENYEFALADTSILTDENIALYAQWKPVVRTLEGGITRLVYRGVLSNFGEWTSGLKKTMHVKVYESASAVEPLWSGDVADVPINPDGSFEAVFGNDELAYAFASNNLTHIELTVGDALSALAPRRAFTSVSSVNRALVAEGAASDIKIGTLGANALIAENITAGSLEAAGTVRVEGNVSVEVKPFAIESGSETTIWRGAGVAAWGNSAKVATASNVVAGQLLWTADREGVAMIHCSGASRSMLRIPATIQFVRPGDEVRAPTWDEGEVSVTVWGYKR